MPYSYNKFKGEVKVKIIDNISPLSHILDVGAGSGTYGELLTGHFDKVDALEIYPKYIQMFDLKNKYNAVFEGNILSFEDSIYYDFIIMGDVLEHLSVKDAQKVIHDVQVHKQALLVAVPYMYEQGEEYGNIYETHLQPDLTPQIMAERYPELKLLMGDDQYGYYVNSFFCQSCHQQ